MITEKDRIQAEWCKMPIFSDEDLKAKKDLVKVLKANRHKYARPEVADLRIEYLNEAIAQYERR